MLWGAPLPERVAPANLLVPLLERAIAASPGNAALHAKLGHARYDEKHYSAAASSFETALGLDREAADFQACLARSYNYLRRHEDVLTLLAGDERPSFERGRALMELGASAAAEAEYRAVLDRQPDDAAACRMLCRMLRRSGRNAELVELCENLSARGAANAQLLYNWGWGLALAGDVERARRLMFEPERVARIALPVPAGFADIASFNAALADEIVSNPNQVSSFAVEDEANRGSCRVENLFAGRRPDLIGLLLELIRSAVEEWKPPARDGFDPWPKARPAAARPRSWGLIQRRDEYEEGHIHPGGWLSGVYYVRIPAIVTEAGAGPGCIEFGPPSNLAEAMPGLAPVGRYRPEEGMLLLAPSHYQHRTIPSGADEQRISVAFDLVPDRQDLALVGDGDDSQAAGSAPRA